MMKSFIVNGDFDGAKFAKRYGLNSFRGDFSMNGNVLTVKDESKITDDPPIFEAPDPFVAKPTIEERLAALEKDVSDLKAKVK